MIEPSLLISQFSMYLPVPLVALKHVANWITSAILTDLSPLTSSTILLPVCFVGVGVFDTLVGNRLLPGKVGIVKVKDTSDYGVYKYHRIMGIPIRRWLKDKSEKLW